MTGKTNDAARWVLTKLNKSWTFIPLPQSRESPEKYFQLVFKNFKLLE